MLQGLKALEIRVSGVVQADLWPLGAEGGSQMEPWGCGGKSRQTQASCMFKAAGDMLAAGASGEKGRFYYTSGTHKALIFLNYFGKVRARGNLP